jgi:hypothetical protein
MDSEPESSDGPHPFPVVARHIPDQLPLIVRLRLDPAEVDKAFATPPIESPKSEPFAFPPDREHETDVGGVG